MLRRKSSASSTGISQVKAKRQLRSLIYLLSYPVIFLVLISSVFIAHQRLFVITNLDCQSLGNQCPDEVTYYLNQYKNRSLLWVNQDKVALGLKQTGLVESSKINFVLPGKMSVNIQPVAEYFPLAVFISDIMPTINSFISTQSSSLRIMPDLNTFISTQSAVIYRLLSTGSLCKDSSPDPQLVFIGSGLPNKDIATKIFSWQKAIVFSKIGFKKIYIFNNQIIADDNNWDVIYDLNADPADGLFALQQLRSVATIREPKVIDFRFNHPILK